MRAVITGASRGIGKAIAIKLAQSGYNLAICARNEPELRATAGELEAMGVTVLAYVADCTKKNEIAAFCDFIFKKWPTIDVLVNNAGTFLPAPILDEPDEAFEMQLSLNLSAAYYFSKFFGAMMRTQKHGHIFNICSIASITPAENAGSYSVTKSALLCLNNVMRQELSRHSVKVTAILPGPTITSSWNGEAVQPEKFVKPADIAEILFTTLSLSSAANVEQIVIKPV